MSQMSEDEEIVTRRQITKIKPKAFLPKPRRVVTNELSSNSTSASLTPAPSGAVSPSKARSKVYDDDDDTFFTRKTAFSRKMTSKKTRTSEILRTLEDNPKLPTNETEKEDLKQKAKSKSKGKGKSLSDWTTSDEPIIMFDEESDNIYDSDLSDDTGDRKKIIRNPIENKRVDDKEDSLTPPPEINHYLLQSTLAPLHATLSQYSGALRSDGNEIGSPVISSALQDDIELDPELLAIQQSVKQEECSNKPVDAKVEIMVIPKHLPIMPVNDENDAISDYEKPIKFIIKAEDTFEQLIIHLCSKKGIPKQDLVLTYKNVKVFPRGTPSSLGMSGLVHLESYTKESYMYFKEQQEIERNRLFEELEEDSTTGVNNTSLNFSKDIESNDHEIDTIMNEEDNYLHLKFQCQDETIEKLKVKKSLTVQAIIERYKKIKGISGNVIKLLFEDEVLPPEEQLINTELEDGDILSVKIMKN